MSTEKHFAKIVLPDSKETGPFRCQGTRVFVGDKELAGVTEIKLYARPDDVWRGEITLMLDAPADLLCDAFIHRPTLWQRVKQWLRRC